MTRRRRVLAQADTITLDEQLIETMRHAALTGDLDRAVTLADAMVAEHRTERAGRNILANACFHAGLKYGGAGQQSSSPYALLGLRLVDDGWCTDEDMAADATNIQASATRMADTDADDTTLTSTRAATLTTAAFPAPGTSPTA
ncbi:hypothetical protein [Saccharopolyspora phatthalungensis]|uniref:Uncharacterized protein n=1 Tax=Saccharopolyspora phatthalungensis TaxID=664693 RepID=A0A840QHE0_9PSEU|nr:hypothetical protein [Saccharopolyspora phatthalungensis]MBB5158059.1 hypothetical protein [Saccharopolyspora phatthalungensis]